MQTDNHIREIVREELLRYGLIGILSTTSFNSPQKAKNKEIAPGTVVEDSEGNRGLVIWVSESGNIKIVWPSWKEDMLSSGDYLLDNLVGPNKIFNILLKAGDPS